MVGYHRIGGTTSALGTPTFRAHDPRTGQPTGDWYADATPQEITRAIDLAVDAAAELAGLSSGRRGALLTRLADQLGRHHDRLVAQADLETGLGTRHLSHELAACRRHLRSAAAAVGRGADVGARLTRAERGAGDRPGTPASGSLWTGIGPVVIIEADASPFVLGVPGIDTASALAAGCPVVVRASAHHPATAQACAAVVDAALRELGWPAGSHAVLHGGAATVTEDLVAADGVAAAGFTGDPRAGRALADLAVARPDPIRFHGRHPAVNPVIVTAEAVAGMPGQIAAELVRATTAAAGQDLLRPSVVVLPDDVASDWFVDAVVAELRTVEQQPLLSAQRHAAFTTEVARRLETPGVTQLTDRVVDTASGYTQHPVLLLLGADDLLADAELARPGSGPVLTLVRTAADRTTDVVRALPHSMVAHLYRGDGSSTGDAAIVAALADRADRVVVRDDAAPADDRSPGRLLPPDDPLGLRRWQRAVAYEGVDDWLRPPALGDDNPLGLVRTVDGHRTRDGLD